MRERSVIMRVGIAVASVWGMVTAQASFYRRVDVAELLELISLHV